MVAKYFVKEPSEEHKLLREQNDLLQQLVVEQRRMTTELLKELRTKREAPTVYVQTAALPAAAVEDFDFDMPDEEVFIPRANLNSEANLKSLPSQMTEEIPEEELAKLRKHKDSRK